MSEEGSPLVIAAGTDWEVTVWDLRDVRQWSKYEPFDRRDQPRLIVYHHTATYETRYDTREALLQRLTLLASVSPYGLPYNFVVGYAPDAVVCYLNDIDRCWPHTLGHNDAVAICALGNFDVGDVAVDLPDIMGRTADALAVMWGRYVPEVGHRQLAATACPGSHLFAALNVLRDLEVPP